MKVSKAMCDYMDHLVNEIDKKGARIKSLELDNGKLRGKNKYLMDQSKSPRDFGAVADPSTQITATSIRQEQQLQQLQKDNVLLRNEVFKLKTDHPAQPSTRETSLAERVKYLEGVLRGIQHVTRPDQLVNNNPTVWCKCQDALYTYGTDQDKP